MVDWVLGEEELVLILDKSRVLWVDVGVGDNNKVPVPGGENGLRPNLGNGELEGISIHSGESPPTTARFPSIVRLDIWELANPPTLTLIPIYTYKSMSCKVECIVAASHKVETHLYVRVSLELIIM